ncbi:hypothetical protein RSOL_238670 [Rhizoctonia solani AG-3 Rhs1AP]|uniref:CxC2-like cysteine cluster KDZ transposase-associated domain-containing protein n=1 Tax=Rhizoctonia solani AG-3 Rhs1AP TaxID=1086054 RepID=A0A0A1UHK1_9AGAM|nr:hypothetical protein RSOL_238670 [Rhizoctonia solani AG-3 Rhs1AP]
MDNSALTELTVLDEPPPPSPSSPPALGRRGLSTTLDGQHSPDPAVELQDPTTNSPVADAPPPESRAESTSAETSNWSDPNLSCPRVEWRSSLNELWERATESFLAQGAESQTTRALSNDIPRFLNACIQVLAWSTGAYIKGRAVWFNHDDPTTVRAYSTLSETAQALNTPNEVREEMGYFADRVFDNIGQYFERRLFNAYPTIYTVPAANGRPMLPPPHSSLEQRVQTLDRWFAVLRDVADAILSKNNIYFSLARVPGRALPWGLPLDQWGVQDVDRLYNFILSHQTRLLAGDPKAKLTAFQWMETTLDEEFRTTPADPKHDLYHLEETAYSLAMMSHTFRDDAYLPVSAEPRRWFTHEFLHDYQRFLTPLLNKFLACIELNERKSPPYRKRLPSDPAILRLMPTNEIDVGKWLMSFDMPDAVSDQMHDDHDEHNVRVVFKFIVKFGALFLEDGVAGGTEGVYSVGLYMLAMSKFIDEEHERFKGKPAQAHRVQWKYNEGLNLKTIMQTLIGEIENSKSPKNRPEVSSQPEYHRWAPKALEFSTGEEPSTVSLEWPMGQWGTDGAILHEGGDKPGQPRDQHDEPARPTENQKRKGKQREAEIEMALPVAPSEPNVETEAAASRGAARAPLANQAEVIQLEDSEEEDLYINYPKSGQAQYGPTNEGEDSVNDSKSGHTKHGPIDEGDVSVTDSKLGHTKHRSIPNPFMPPPSQPPAAGPERIRKPFTVQSIPAELPAVPEEPRQRSLSLNEGSRPVTSANEGLGLGLTVDPPIDDISAFGLPLDTSTPYPRGRPLVREQSRQPGQSEVPVAEGTNVAQRKRPPIKPKPAASSQPGASVAPSQPTKPSAVSTSKSPVPTSSTLPSSFTAVQPKASTTPTPSKADQVATSMLGAFAQSEQAAGRINYCSEPGAAVVHTTRRQLKRTVKRRHGSSEEENTNKKPESKKSRSASRNSQKENSFPERDPTVGDPSPLTFSKDVVDDFYEIVRQWYRNRTRNSDPAPSIPTMSKDRRTSARNLAMKRYSQAIAELARTISVKKPELHQMSAFNEATTQFLDTLKRDDLPAYEKLQGDAVELRQASEKDYTDLSPDNLAQLLTDFPNKLHDELAYHGKTLPVHIWSIVSFAIPPSQEMKTYTLRGMDTSDNHSVMVNSYKDWMRSKMGTAAARQIDTAEPMVYPDIKNHMRPCLPNHGDVESLSTLQLRTLLRTYFNYTARWQGHHTGVPWAIMRKDDKYHFIRQSCFQPGVSTLKKVGEMKRDELILWYQWILDGQEQRLEPAHFFQFTRLPQPNSQVVLQFPEPITSRPSTSNLSWTPEEKLYARRIQKSAEDALNDPAWKGLPLARLQEVYEPFSASMRTAMSTGCSEEFQPAVIVSLLFELERYGPVHTQDLSNREPLIAYLGSKLSDETLSELLLTQTLNPAALLADDPQHPDYSVPSYIRWVKLNTRLRHELSGTWRGGPDGARGIVAVYIHIANAFSMYQHCSDKMPSSLVKAFDKCDFERLHAQLVAFGNWLLASLQDTISKLKVTFSARAQAWKQAVVGQYLTRSMAHTGHSSLSRDTHGLPHSTNKLSQSYKALQASNPDITMGLDNQEFQKVKKRIRARASEIEEELSDRDSTSAEEIVLPESDEMSGSDNERELLSPRSLGDYGQSHPEKEPHLEVNNLTIIARLDNVSITRSGQAGSSMSARKLRSRSKSRSLDESEFRLPASTGFETHEESSADEGNLTNTILTDISPMKLHPVKPRMRMEVVIPTTRKRLSVTTQDATAPDPSPHGASSEAASPADAAASKPNTFHVERKGTRRQVRHVALEDQATSADPPIHLTKNPPTALSLEDIEDIEVAQDELFDKEGTSEGGPLPFDTDLRDVLEEQAEEYAEIFSKDSGQGQNSMLREWLRDHSHAYLREFYKRYESPLAAHCLCDLPVGDRYRCDDCTTDFHFCSECINTSHRTTPTHRISRWTGQTWSKTSLKTAGLVFELGGHPACKSKQTVDLSIGDVTGYHDVRISHCRCHGVDLCAMLLRANLMPCSDFEPRSAFTFRALRIFDVLAADAKLSASRFHTVIQRQTNNVLPHAQPSRLRELLRVTRQYLYLQLLKRADKQRLPQKTWGALPSLPAVTTRITISSDVAITLNGFSAR